jgi:hypothetical protein
MNKLLVLVLVLVSANALAQVSAGPDGLGIYFFENGAWTNTKMNAEEGAQITAYLVATNISQPNGISGWDCEIALDGNILMDDVSWMAPQPTWAATNVSSPPQFVVGIAPPIATVPTISLLTFRFPFPAPGGLVLLGFGPIITGFLGSHGSPGYQSGTIWTPFIPSSNALPIPGRPGFYYVACAGGEGPIVATNDSWSSVKSLYR